MNTQFLIIQAEKFLNKLGARYVGPAEVGMIEITRIEIIFMRPEAFDPNVVIDPPDIRVWVDRKTGEVELIEQM